MATRLCSCIPIYSLLLLFECAGFISRCNGDTVFRGLHQHISLKVFVVCLLGLALLNLAWPRLNLFKLCGSRSVTEPAVPVPIITFLLKRCSCLTGSSVRSRYCSRHMRPCPCRSTRERGRGEPLLLVALSSRAQAWPLELLCGSRTTAAVSNTNHRPLALLLGEGGVPAYSISSCGPLDNGTGEKPCGEQFFFFFFIYKMARFVIFWMLCALCASRQDARV